MPSGPRRTLDAWKSGNVRSAAARCSGARSRSPDALADWWSGRRTRRGSAATRSPATTSRRPLGTWPGCSSPSNPLSAEWPSLVAGLPYGIKSDRPYGIRTRAAAGRGALQMARVGGQSTDDHAWPTSRVGNEPLRPAVSGTSERRPGEARPSSPPTATENGLRQRRSTGATPLDPSQPRVRSSPVMPPPPAGPPASRRGPPGRRRRRPPRTTYGARARREPRANTRTTSPSSSSDHDGISASPCSTAQRSRTRRSRPIVTPDA